MALITLAVPVESGIPVTQKANQVETSKSHISIGVRLFKDGVELPVELPLLIRSDELSGTALTKLENVIEDVLRFRGFIA